MINICNSYIALDIETTGLSLRDDRIIELGAVKVIDGIEQDTFSTLINPRMKLSEHIKKLTNIDDESLSSMPDIEEVIEELLLFMEDLPLLGHNIIFDYSFIKKVTVNLRLDLEKQGIDTLRLLRLCLPDLESKRLKSACEHFGIAQDREHRALDDAIASHRLYQRLRSDFRHILVDCEVKKDLICKIKRQQKASKTQKERLQNILNCHKISLDVDIDSLSKNEISRIIDRLRFKAYYDKV